MPWYEMKVSHGPGHNSIDTNYHWSESKLSNEEKELVIENWIDASPQVFEDPVVILKPRIVKYLPEKIKKEKIDRYHRQYIKAIHMLRVLGAF